MIIIRPSVPADIPSQRHLWQLAFGDDGNYIDNFYDNYYRPDRVLVLEEDGVVRSMTAWFDTTFVVPGSGNFRAAYLYAVATHPDCRGRGLAAQLLSGADNYFRGLGLPAVTTVPAAPSLHGFFGANGFRECFTLAEKTLETGALPVQADNISLRPASAADYGAVREKLLANIPHISYPEDALVYQAGCCAISGGGLFVGEAGCHPACACAEGDGTGLILYKEVLGLQPTALPYLTQLLPGERFVIRGPVSQWPENSGTRRFAMLKWLEPQQDSAWDWTSTAYLGLAFD